MNSILNYTTNPEYLPFEPANIPQPLKERGQWLLWVSKERGNGKWTKVPISIKAKMGDVNDPTTWASFNEVVEVRHAVQNDPRYTLHHLGIGFVFTKDDPNVGVDLDKCIYENGSLHPKAREIVEKLGSYTEFSAGGKGLHVIATGEVMKGKRCGPVEMYSYERYFTMTGQIFEGRNEIVDRSVVLRELHESLSQTEDTKDSSLRSSYSRNHQEKRGEGYRYADCLNDKQLLRRIRQSKSGSAFKKLWSGDTSDYDYDHSRADLALLAHLKWWCNGNEEQADRLFNQSGLCRDKWLNRQDYRERSFDKLRG